MNPATFDLAFPTPILQTCAGTVQSSAGRVPSWNGIGTQCPTVGPAINPHQKISRDR